MENFSQNWEDYFHERDITFFDDRMQHRCVEFDGSEFKNRHDSRVSRFMGRLIPTICRWLAATMASCSIHDCNIGAGPAGSIFTTKTRRIGQLSRADRNWTLSRIGHEWFHRKKYPPIGCTRTRPDFRPFWILSGWSRGPIESPPFSPPRIHQPSSLICNFLRARHSSFLDWEKNYKSMNISNSNHASFDIVSSNLSARIISSRNSKLNETNFAWINYRRKQRKNLIDLFRWL